MTFIDPTYLRNVRDGLESGSYDKANPASLPDGIIGIFEEALFSGLDVRFRKDLMDFFTVWSIVKCDVSLEFVHSLLPGWSMDRVSDHVQSYSRWFNAIKPGRLLLYHERLRVFLLQRTSQSSLMFFNQAIIDQCRMALDRCNGDEWETYALQYMSKHLLLASIDSESAGAQLQKMACDTLHWDRQLVVSKNFDWTRSMLKDMMQWASRYNEDQMVECALNLVDLHYREQNDASRIVQLVADGDIDSALQSIETFGGKDKEGMKRKFILYMLCLMELTLLSGKDKPFRRTAIETILSHFDQYLRVDHSILKWNDFFPSYLVFLMACEWAEMGLDYMIVHQRTDEWDTNWLPEKGPYSEVQFELLIAYARGVNDKYNRDDLIMNIAIAMAKQGRKEESLSRAGDISDESVKCAALIAISSELAKQGKKEAAASVIKESECIARGITNDGVKYDTLNAIFIALAIQGKEEAATSLLEETLSIARGFSDENDKINALLSISSEIARRGKKEEAAYVIKESLSIARAIRQESIKSRMVLYISSELAKQGKKDEASTLIGETLSIARGISKEDLKCAALTAISSELAKQGKKEAAASVIEEALSVVRVSINNYIKFNMFRSISSELAKQGKKDEASTLIGESLSIATGISKESIKCDALLSISSELAKQGRIEESLLIAHGIRDESEKCDALLSISSELAKQGKKEAAASVIEESINIARGMIKEWSQSNALWAISAELAKQGRIEESLLIARGISDEYGHDKSRALLSISSELAKQGKKDEAASVIEESINIARGMIKEWSQSNVLWAISAELAKQGRIEESLLIARGISDEYGHAKSRALLSISSELATQGMKEDAASVMEESRSILRGISNEYDKSRALLSISAELSIQGRIEEALSIARGFSDESKKCDVLRAISAELAKQGRLTFAEEIGLEITKDLKRQDCWEKMAKARVEKVGWNFALKDLYILTNEEARIFYLKVWADNIPLTETDEALLKHALPILANDSQSIESVLQKYALHALFLGNEDKAQIHRLHRTLNIQWALDIHDSLPSNNRTTRTSTNLEDWISELPDEDDREIIRSLARQVAKGKITETEFSNRVQALLYDSRN
jgi:hypothetical protein